MKIHSLISQNKKTWSANKSLNHKNQTFFEYNKPKMKFHAVLYVLWPGVVTIYAVSTRRKYPKAA